MSCTAILADEKKDSVVHRENETATSESRAGGLALRLLVEERQLGAHGALAHLQALLRQRGPARRFVPRRLASRLVAHRLVPRRAPRLARRAQPEA